MESYKLIKSNGEELEFNVGDFYLLSLVGFGNPDINYTTQKTFYLDGEIVTNFVVSPRRLTLPFLGNMKPDSNRIEYWELRRRILSFLSPLSGPFTLQITLDDHSVYELTNVYPENGLSLDGNTFNPERNDGRIDENLILTAFDPIWRNATLNSTGMLSPTIASSLTFPFTFPFTFGASGANFSATVNYTGTWRSYPKITLSGPYTTASLTMSTTGASFTLIEPVSAGETRVIDLTDPFSGFTIKDNFGVNKISDLNLGANLTQFYFEPDKVNTITASLNGGNQSQTKLKVEWYTKYLGI